MELQQQLILISILLALVIAGIIFVLVQVGRVETPKVIAIAGTALLLASIGVGVVAATSPVDSAKTPGSRK